MKNILLSMCLVAGLMSSGITIQSVRAEHGITDGGCYRPPHHHHHQHYSSGYGSYMTPYRAAYYGGIQRVPQVIVVPGGYRSGFGYSSPYGSPAISTFGVGPSLGTFGVPPTYGMGYSRVYGSYPGLGYGSGFGIRIGF